MQNFDLLTSQFLNFLPNFLSGLLIILLFLAIWFFFKKSTLYIIGRFNKQNQYIAKAVSKTINVTILVIGIITAMGTWGIDVRTLIASLGLTGFAIGFALKDILSNIASGVLLLLYRPFSVGDKINVFGVEGEVINIDMRYTTLKSEGKINLIPNSKLLTEKITIDNQ